MIPSLVHVFVLCLVVLVEEVSLLENGLARTPPMGWMSWGYYMCADKCDENPDKCLDEKLIMSVADTFFSEGYQEAGYEYIIIDDCWSEKARDWQGRLVPDRLRFPRGMKFLADYIHSKGLKFGMYTNIAKTTCMHYPGSRGHFETDARMFAEWDIDYLKVDGCFVEEDYLDGAYTSLGHWLNVTGRPMVYSCSWPYYKKFTHKHEFDFNKIVPVCNLWRNFHDIFVNWGNVVWIIRYYEEQARTFQSTHGPGHWHDPDMLIIGTNHLTEGQSRVHMAVWAMLSAPLLISCDMKRVTQFEKRLLQNLDLLAVAQDSKGIMALPYKINQDVTVWVKPHLPMKGDSYYSYSYAIVNLGKSKHTINFIPRMHGLNATVEYSVLDIFSGDMFRNITYNDNMSVTVPSEDVVMYSMYPL
ncbi:alpha galactosidase A domain-containing protein [Phthorimaea operculella]|nr:alpha galactosidase A domain-containing protein [Phthorimaea operculella]